MSLAEDRRRPYEGVANRAATPAPARKTLAELRPQAKSIAARDNRDLRHEPAQHAAPPVPPADTSLDLLDKASRGVVFILARYKQLEEHVKQLDAWAKSQIQAAESVSARWQETALAAEKQAEALQTVIDRMTREAELAELASQSDKHALKILQDRVLASFGLGSEVYDAIKAVGIE